jgi:hypothetical protein
VCEKSGVGGDEESVVRVEDVAYVGYRVACEVAEQGDHFFEFDVQGVGEPGGDGDGVFGMPLVAEVIIIDDDCFSEISSEE